MSSWSTSSKHWCVWATEAASRWDRKINTCGTCEYRSFTDCAGTGQWRLRSCKWGKGDIEALTRYRTRIGTTKKNVLQLFHEARGHTYQYSQRAHLCLDYSPLGMQFCERFHQHATYDAFSHNILWADEERFMRESALNKNLIDN